MTRYQIWLPQLSCECFFGLYAWDLGVRYTKPHNGVTSTADDHPFLYVPVRAHSAWPAMHDSHQRLRSALPSPYWQRASGCVSTCRARHNDHPGFKTSHQGTAGRSFVRYGQQKQRAPAASRKRCLGQPHDWTPSDTTEEARSPGSQRSQRGGGAGPLLGNGG